MGSLLYHLDKLDKIFEKYKELRKHLIGSTKLLVIELEQWKKDFLKEYDR